jgi:cytoskeletal protein RodZ
MGVSLVSSFGRRCGSIRLGHRLLVCLRALGLGVLGWRVWCFWFGWRLGRLALVCHSLLSSRC